MLRTRVQRCSSFGQVVMQAGHNALAKGAALLPRFGARDAWRRHLAASAIVPVIVFAASAEATARQGRSRSTFAHCA
jgi:hypothetical protein